MHDIITQQTAPFIAHGALAVFGAIVHSLNAVREGRSKTWTDHLILMTIASFTGVMFGIAGIYWFGAGSYPALLITGAGGYMGPQGWAYLQDYILKLKPSK